VDQHNAVHLIPQRMAGETHNLLFRSFLQRETQQLRRYEVHTCQQFDRVVWVTRQDYAAVSAWQEEKSPTGRKIPDTVIPICVDPAATPPDQKITAQPNLLFIGGMNWPPNADGVRWFVKEIFPLVRAEIPGATLCVVGKMPPEDILAVEGVTAPGFVGDLESHWADSRVFIVPLRAGGGMRVKILDAWAHERPVVSTTIGAEGISYHDGVNILIADKPLPFAQKTIQLLRDQRQANLIAKAGRANLLEKYDWRITYQDLDKVFLSN
jgi:polysaccharide biosynthesis protein PslH